MNSSSQSNETVHEEAADSTGEEHSAEARGHASQERGRQVCLHPPLLSAALNQD